MSLDPSPLSSRPTPLLNPSDPVPGRGSALVGAIIAVALAVVVGFVSTKAGTSLLFFSQGIFARSNIVVNQLPQIQGFNYYWTGGYDAAGVTGYRNTTATQKIFAQEANQYHMNLVVITVTADVNQRTGTNVDFTAGQAFDNTRNIDTYPASTYTALAKEAIAQGMTPVFRLDIRVLNYQSLDPSSTMIGQQWQSNSDSSLIGAERDWFNSYTKFAVYYAQLAQQLGMPMLIIGQDLYNIAFDSPDTNTGATSTAKLGLGGDAGVKCFGRRDCEWRHVISAIRNTTYVPLGSKAHVTGGGYSGVLTFAATVKVNLTLGINTPEWQDITWWDALDVIGVDAFFPLTTAQDNSTSTLVNAWNGAVTSVAISTPAPNYVAQLRKLADKYAKHILFTGAGYETISGSNQTPGRTNLPSDLTIPPDNTEQASDMESLLKVFSNETWWLGVIWSSDYPQWPRHALTATSINPNTVYGLENPYWAFNTEWAGECLPPATCPYPEKGGGAILRQYYQAAPLSVTLWENLGATVSG